MTYDAKGNITTDEDGNQYVYDAENRMVEEKDARGRLIARHNYDQRARCVIEIKDYSSDVQ